jgi:hypothetical protein
MFMMKNRFCLLAIVLFLSLSAFSQTILVSGPQSGIWDADTVLVVGDVRVHESLGINPGTTVLFKGFYSIRVDEGVSIKAVGKENDSILFTVIDTTDFHVFDSKHGGWNGIRLDHAQASHFEYCRFQFGKAALDDDQDGGALRIFNCEEVEINHSTLFCNFSREHGGALNAEKSKVLMHDCNVYSNQTYTKLDTVYYMYGGGLRFINCKVELVDTDFRYNIGASAIGGALSLDSCSVIIDRCRFEHNYGINGGGLYLIRSNHMDCTISNSLFANNISGHFGGGLAISESSPLVSNITVVNNLSSGVNCGGIFFYQHSSPKMVNCIIYGNANDAPLEKPVQMWVWTYDDYVPEFYNCLVQYDLENITGYESIKTYENCFDKDPFFVDAEREDFHLKGDSPCIDAGLIIGTEGFDLDGIWRVCGHGIDVGAYEYSATGVDETLQQVASLCVVGNPITSDSYAEINCEKNSEGWLKIYALNGKLLVDTRTEMLHVGTNRIALGTLFQPLAKGAYLLVVQSGNQTFSAKVIR